MHVTSNPNVANDKRSDSVTVVPLTPADGPTKAMRIFRKGLKNVLGSPRWNAPAGPYRFILRGTRHTTHFSRTRSEKAADTVSHHGNRSLALAGRCSSRDVDSRRSYSFSGFRDVLHVVNRMVIFPSPPFIAVMEKRSSFSPSTLGLGVKV